MKNKTMYICSGIIYAMLVICTALCVVIDYEILIALSVYGTVTLFLALCYAAQIYLCNRQKHRTAIILTVIKYVLALAAVLLFGSGISLANAIMGGSGIPLVMSFIFQTVLIFAFIFETVLFSEKSNVQRLS